MLGAEAQGLKKMGQSVPRTLLLLLLLLAGLLGEARGGFPNTISIGKRHPVAPGRRGEASSSRPGKRGEGGRGCSRGQLGSGPFPQPAGRCGSGARAAGAAAVHPGTDGRLGSVSVRDRRMV